LSNYLHGLGKEALSLETAGSHYTDALKIYLPERISLFSNRDDNFLLYKLMVTHKFAMIKLGTYRLNPDEVGPTIRRLRQRYGEEPNENLRSELSRFLHLFPDPKLAKDLLNFLETVRIEGWIEDNLPGLFRELGRMKKMLGLKRGRHWGLPPRSQMVDIMVYWWLTGKFLPSKAFGHLEIAGDILDLLKTTDGQSASLQGNLLRVAEMVEMMNPMPGLYETVPPIPYMGEMRPEEAERGRLRKRESTRAEFRAALAQLVAELPEPKEVRIQVPEVEQESLSKTPQRQVVPEHLLFDGNPIPLPEGMKKLIEEIYEDLGSIPGSYLAITDEMSGHAFRSLCQTSTIGTSNVLSEHGKDVFVYDEWDYRRQGYRKRWALLRETEASEGSLDFAEETLKCYGGMVHQIKRQFERIRLEQQLLRRQKEGDHVDLDAAIEAFSDQKAGLNPSERLFMHLRRDKRDIATIFLIDLSGSTSGWINEMERTSLLILSEAMEVLRDRFAVYGFSGRTRKRCELFRVKGFEESYGEKTKRRIANLRALDYTRLGPPIRHVTKLLSGMEAKTRLLITLSDGKPDDYDGYRGDYGIEDTRQALVEAKRLGIHPFCITIDKAEHSYLSHMYGPVNYVFIDDISKLPLKVPEIYRKLTT
jgi:nitric oxide reductase NorD protein